MATHSSTLAWKTPCMKEPGKIQSMGSLRVGHDRVTSLSLFTFIHWRRKWQPPPVFLPGESQGWRSLAGYGPWDQKELDTTEATAYTYHLETVYFNFLCQEMFAVGLSYMAFIVLRWEKAMAAHSSTLAWKIPWMVEAGRLQSMGSLRDRHN